MLVNRAQNLYMVLLFVLVVNCYYNDHQANCHSQEKTAKQTCDRAERDGGIKAQPIKQFADFASKQDVNAPEVT